MEDPEDFDDHSPHLVRHDEGGSRDDQLPRPVEPSRTARMGMVGQGPLHGLYGLDDLLDGRRWVVGLDQGSGPLSPAGG